VGRKIQDVCFKKNDLRELQQRWDLCSCKVAERRTDRHATVPPGSRFGLQDGREPEKDIKLGASIDHRALEAFADRAWEPGSGPRHVQIGGLGPEMDLQTRSAIAAFVRGHAHLEISLHAYPYNFREEADPVRSVWLSLARETLDLAAETGARSVTFHAGHGIGAGERATHQRCPSRFIEAFGTIVAQAEALGIEVHLENLYQEPRSSDFGYIGDRPSDFERILRELRSPAFRLCYDYGHGNLQEDGIDILRRNIRSVGSLHVHDNDQVSDIHWGIGNPGRGTIDWGGELDFLREAGFGGAFILECDLPEQTGSLDYLKGLTRAWNQGPRHG
jgi:sugar phosphate isomerase/epimerase